MNGISLLVALAAVGIEVGLETTPSGVDIYTIRIEAVVVDTLRNGSAIESVVKPSERETLRQFRVVVGPRNQQTQRAAMANELDYGWSPNDAGGIDYYVQISPERLETLARGVPLECIVHREVPAIDKIFVFVGGAELPRKLPPGLRSIDNSRNVNVAPASGTDTNLSAPRYSDAGYGTPANTATNSSDPNRNLGYGPPSPQVTSPASNYRDQGSSATGRYGQYGDATLPVPPLDNNRPTDYDYKRNQYAPQQDPYSRPQPQQPYPPQTQTAALPQQQTYLPPPAPTVPVAVQQQPSSASAANPTMDALAAVLALQQKQLDKPKTSEESEKKSQSSKPLILTTLALFASIGANAYLGWLAWSFFWRFRDAASDLSRARSNAFPVGSVAGH